MSNYNGALLTEADFVMNVDLCDPLEQHNPITAHDELLLRIECLVKDLEEHKQEVLRLSSENNMLRKRLKEDAVDDKLYSSFIWVYFQDQMMPFPDLKTNDLCRLIFLSTYCDYKTNVLVEYGVPIPKENLRRVMKLNRCIYNPWLKKMLELGYISFKDENIVISKKFFSRGILKKTNNVKPVRFFTDMIRDLYSSLKPDDHHKMGFMIRLIPYMNPYLNCLARNSYEKNIEMLVPLKIGELSEKLGYSKMHCKRLANDLLCVKFGEDSKRIAITAALDCLSQENQILMFNTKLFFAGNVDEYRVASEIFENCQQIDLSKLDSTLSVEK